MSLYRFNIDDSMYEQFKRYCEVHNIVPSVLLRNFVYNIINGNDDGMAIHGHKEDVEEVIEIVPELDMYPQFDPYTGERMN